VLSVEELAAHYVEAAAWPRSRNRSFPTPYLEQPTTAPSESIGRRYQRFVHMCNHRTQDEVSGYQPSPNASCA